MDEDSPTPDGGSRQYSAILVKSTSQAIKIERIIESKCLLCRLVPTPREFSSDCGSAIRIDRNDAETIRNLIEAAGAGPVEIRDMGIQ